MDRLKNWPVTSYQFVLWHSITNSTFSHHQRHRLHHSILLLATIVFVFLCDLYSLYLAVCNLQLSTNCKCVWMSGTANHQPWHVSATKSKTGQKEKKRRDNEPHGERVDTWRQSEFGSSKSPPALQAARPDTSSREKATGYPWWHSSDSWLTRHWLEDVNLTWSRLSRAPEKRRCAVCKTFLSELEFVSACIEKGIDCRHFPLPQTGPKGKDRTHLKQRVHRFWSQFLEE